MSLSDRDKIFSAPLTFDKENSEDAISQNYLLKKASERERDAVAAAEIFFSHAGIERGTDILRERIISAVPNVILGSKTQHA
jgi:hypothetical protein